MTLKNKSIIKVWLPAGIAWLVALSSGSPAHAFVAIDNTNDVTGVSGGLRIDYSNAVVESGVSFTTGASSSGYSIQELLVSVFIYQGTADYVLNLYAGLLPSGSPIAIDPISIANLNDPYFNSLDSAAMPNISKTLLSPSTAYSLTITASSGNFGFGGWGYVDPPAPYVTSGGFVPYDGIQQVSDSGFAPTGVAPLYRLTVQEVGVPVPAPLPLFGAFAAFGYSRQLRKRLRDDRFPVASAID